VAVTTANSIGIVIVFKQFDRDKCYTYSGLSDLNVMSLSTLCRPDNCRWMLQKCHNAADIGLSRLVGFGFSAFFKVSVCVRTVGDVGPCVRVPASSNDLSQHITADGLFSIAGPTVHVEVYFSFYRNHGNALYKFTFDILT